MVQNFVVISKVIDFDGWFEIGDLGWKVLFLLVGLVWMCGGFLVLDGCVKDIIVLLMGVYFFI